MTDDHDRIAQEALQRVTRAFFGEPKPKRQRAKPHRCFDCGKVTRYIRCPECSAKRRNEK